MTISEFVTAAAKGFTRILDFQGRETRNVFAPYAILIVILDMLFMQAAMYRHIQPLINLPIGSEVDFFEITAIFTPIAASTFIIVFLLAAAVTRRLRDTGKSPAFGLLPLPFLTASMIMMRELFSSFPDPNGMDMGLFTLMFANNLIYILSLGLLIFLLCQPSKHSNSETRI